jgi:hypothetical protein
LQDKLDFLHKVAGMSYDELNKSPAFTYSLDGRMRPRFFYALLKGTVHRCSMSTLLLEADPSYVTLALGRGVKCQAHGAEAPRMRRARSPADATPRSGSGARACTCAARL